MALGIDELKIGTWTSPDIASGCTVILPPPGTLGAIAVRGQAPGTREAAVLGPHGKVESCHGVVLSGGSAYGLSTADGVMRWLETKGIGYPVGPAVVPIVGAAIILDRAVLHRDARPDARAGGAACESAVSDDPGEGSVGAGAGATVAKVGGLGHAWQSGQGLAIRRSGDLIVAALVVNNAVGEVVDDDGVVLVASRAPSDVSRFPFDPAALMRGADEFHAPTSTGLPSSGGTEDGPVSNTVIGVVVTNARLTKVAAHRVADLAHDGIARAVRPAHTSLDGDALFTLATQQVEAPLDLVNHLAVEVVADAARRGPLAAMSGHGLPGKADVSGAR